MTVVSFALKTVIANIIPLIKEPIIKKLFIKFKLKKIKSFNKKYENTFVDSNSFQNFLNKEETSHLIFNYIFGSKFIDHTKKDMIAHLTKLAIDDINIFRISNNMPKIHEQPEITLYFDELLSSLEEQRDNIFKKNEMVLLANIQNAILENNNAIKTYLEENYELLQQKSYFNKFEDSYLNELLDKAIKDLGKRYISQANVTTKYENLFKSISADKTLLGTLSKKLKFTIDNFNELYFKILKNVVLFERANIDTSFIKNSLDKINKYQITSSSLMEKNKISILLVEIEKLVRELDDFVNIINTIDDISAQDYNLYNIFNIYSDLENFTNLVMPNLISEPYLLVYGDAGIGKSHLLADNAKTLAQNGHSVLFFLGQHFKTNDSPFTQLFSLIDYKGSFDYFFDEINTRAMYKNKRAILIIDALNEGSGKFFWKDHLLGFLNYFKKYEHIAIVLSVRNNFKLSVLPENIYNEFPLQLIEHRGFKNLSLEALEPFFNHYNINPVTFPSLDNECYNPLFLHIYCETFGEDYSDYKGWSILDVLEKYIEKINTKLSIDSRFPFPHNINLVDLILKELANNFLETKKQYTNLSSFYEILKNIASNYTGGYRELLLGLVEENILTINEHPTGENEVYFTYERFSDIYIALEISNKYKDNPNFVTDIISSKDVFYYGIIESLSIVFADRLNLELLDIVDKKSITYNTAESFVRGLSWRNAEKITQSTLIWIEKFIKQKERDLTDLTFEKLLKQSTVTNSPINSKYIYNLLFNTPMNIRDYIWTAHINNHIEIPKELIDIIQKENLIFQQFKYDNFSLLSNILILFFSSTNKWLRDTSTAALTKLFLKEPRIISESLNNFKNIDDPYIFERLLASIYGSIFRIEITPNTLEIIDLIYKNVFDKNEVYPNILIRDYARGIILYFIEKGLISENQYSKIHPPYASKWYEKNYTLDDLDLKSKEIREQNKIQYSGFDYILNSMTTEYGRGTGGYGDFGRYTFGSALYDWRNQFNDQNLSNIATMRILEYGYSEKLHGTFDKNLTGYNRHENKVERIGKKYQWIAFYELLAKLTDNYPVFKEEKVYTDEYKKYKENESKKIMLAFSQMKENKIFKLGSNESSEVLVEEEHILSIKKNFYKPYKGPWDPFVRNYDPTLLEYPPAKVDYNLVENHLPIEPSKSWAQSKEEFQNLKKYVFFKFEGEAYISLGQLLVQKNDHEKFEDKDEFCIKTSAVFVANSEKKNYISYQIDKQGNLGVPWPQAFGVYAFEHYWHPSFESLFYNEQPEEIQSEDAIWEYLWEHNIDYVTQERNSCSYLIPNHNIVKYFGLTQHSEAVWLNNKGEKIAFDAQYFGFETNLLIKEDYLREYLNAHNLCIVWNCYMEKWSNRCRKEEWFISWEENLSIEYKVLDEYIDQEVKSFL